MMKRATMSYTQVILARLLPVILVFSLILPLTTYLKASAETVTVSINFTERYVGFTGRGSYPAYDGIKDTTAASVENIETATLGKVNATLFTMKSSSRPLKVLHNSLADASIPAGSVRYVRYQYYYTGDYDGRAELTFKKTPFHLTKDRTLTSMETLKKNAWSYVTFDLQDEVHPYVLPDGYIPKMEFSPFGETFSSELASDKLYIYQVQFLSEDSVIVIADKSDGTLVQKYPVYFSSGRPEAVGEDPETLYITEGESITLPECPYTLENYVFTGWLCSDGRTLLQPGETVTPLSKTIFSKTTSRTYYVANWVLKSRSFQKLPSILSVPFGNYNMGSNGVMDESNGGMYARRTLNYVYDNILTTRFQFLPDGPGKSRLIIFDGWGWDAMPFDISHFKYCAVVYYWDTDSTREYTPRMSLLGSGSDSSRALTKSVSIDGQPLKKNQWAVCSFDIDFVNNPDLSQLVRWDTNCVVNQVHFYPFGAKNYAKSAYMSADDNLYIGNFIFFKEKPDSELFFSEGYLNGYGDNTFKPTQPLKNSEAAYLLASVLGYNAQTSVSLAESKYADISDKDDYYGPVLFLEENGILSPWDGETFNPDDYTDRGAFLRQIIFAMSYNSKSNYINKNKIPEMTYGGTLTRAEAVSNINTLLMGMSGPSITGLQSPFSDVSESQWFYPDIVLASTRAIVYRNKAGSIEVADMPSTSHNEISDEIVNIPDSVYSEAEKYISSLDRTTKNRIEEIRETDSVYEVKPGGTIFYVSTTDGNPSNYGNSEYSPKKISTLSEVTNLPLKSGDVVLFKRGDTFRGAFTAKSGVTYSAYGDGEKPILTRSPADIADPSKWELVKQNVNKDAKIWKYTDYTIPDIGAINLIDSEGNIRVAYKEIPSYSDGRFWVRGQMGVTEYDPMVELRSNYMFFHDEQYKIENGQVVKVTAANQLPNSSGPVYLRCDEGNPGSIFSEITFNLRTNVISVGGAKGVTVDNLCIKYFGSHGVGAGTCHSLTVTNCEIGWGGGAIQNYNSGNVTRFGNGIEIYGGLTNYTIDNCYVYEIYDAGITHQISSTSGGCYFMDGVYYTNNVLTHSSYNIEYFMSNDATSTTTERMTKDVYFAGNIVRLAGYGWGVQRPDSAPSNIKGWSHNNFGIDYVIENNIFDRCVNLNSGEDCLIQVGASYDASAPYLKNNIFVQAPGRILMRYGVVNYKTDLNSEYIVNVIAGDGNKVYICREDKELYMGNIYWR